MGVAWTRPTIRRLVSMTLAPPTVSSSPDAMRLREQPRGPDTDDTQCRHVGEQAERDASDALLG